MYLICKDKFKQFSMCGLKCLLCVYFRKVHSPKEEEYSTTSTVKKGKSKSRRVIDLLDLLSIVFISHKILI